MGYEDSYADPTSLDLLLSMFINLTMIDLDVQRSWWMPLWSFDLETVGVAAQGSCAIYSIMAMLKIGPVLDLGGSWKVSRLSSISMNLHTISIISIPTTQPPSPTPTPGKESCKFDQQQ